MQDIGTFGGSYSQASAINDLGQVAGYSHNGTDYHAFLYANGGMQDIGTLGGSYSIANGINNYGQMVGYAGTSGNLYSHAFSYSNGNMQDIGTLGGTYSQAYGINDLGQIVGSAKDSNNNQHAFLYNSGSMKDLGTFNSGTWSVAFSINNVGQAVGYGDTSIPGSVRAFLYTNGVMRDLGNFGGPDSYATSINNLGQIVGTATTSSTQVAFVYSDGNMIDLNTLIDPSSGWQLLNATAINDKGQIAGNGHIGLAGPAHAFLMTPTTVVPIPSTFWLFSSSLAGLFGFMRRGHVQRKI